jgi:hypothetical protein
LCGPTVAAIAAQSVSALFLAERWCATRFSVGVSRGSERWCVTRFRVLVRHSVQSVGASLGSERWCVTRFRAVVVHYWFRSVSAPLVSACQCTTLFRAFVVHAHSCGCREKLRFANDRKQVKGNLRKETSQASQSKRRHQAESYVVVRGDQDATTTLEEDTKLVSGAAVARAFPCNFVT